MTQERLRLWDCQRDGEIPKCDCCEEREATLDLSPDGPYGHFRCDTCVEKGHRRDCNHFGPGLGLYCAAPGCFGFATEDQRLCKLHALGSYALSCSEAECPGLVVEAQEDAVYCVAHISGS